MLIFIFNNLCSLTCSSHPFGVQQNYIIQWNSHWSNYGLTSINRGLASRSFARWWGFTGIKKKHKLRSPYVSSIILAGLDAELESTKQGRGHSELVSLTRSRALSAKVGKEAWSIWARTQAILLKSLVTKRSLKQHSRSMSFAQSQY